jgi:hypothetical protein
VTFSLHQSGEKQGFLLDEIAITASVVTIWEQAAIPPRESGRDDFTPRDCLADRRCFAPARRRTRRARARNLRLELLSCHLLSRPRYFSTPGPRQITRSFRVAGTAPIGGQSSVPIDNKSSLSANIRRDSAIHTASTNAKPVTLSPAAQDDRAASLLWERSGPLAGLKA